MPKKKRNQKKKNKSWIKKPIFWILLLAIFLRFYKLSELFHWSLDEEFWSYIPFNIASGYHFPLIGGHISGTGLYSGPLFVWIMAIPFLITRGDPIGIATVVSSLGVLTTAVLFWAGAKLFDKTTGLIAALLSASSFLMVIYDRKYWNASPIPFLSIMAIICLYNLAKGKLKWAYVLALVLAIAFHAHMTSAALILFVFISWIVLKLPVRKKPILSAIALFFSLQLPLLLFELRHQFTNSKALINVLSQSNKITTPSTGLRDIINLALTSAARLITAPSSLDIANELTLCPQYASSRFQPSVWAAALVVISIAFLIRKRKLLGNKLILILIGVNFLGIVWYRIRAETGNWYPGQLSEYFFFPSFPAIFLSLASLTRSAIKKLARRAWIMKLALATLVLTNVVALFTARHSDGFAKKRLVVQEILKKVADEPIALSVESDDPCRLYGYRYLFSFFRIEPAQSYLDPQFNWLYENRLPKTAPSKQVVINFHEEALSFTIDQLPH